MKCACCIKENNCKLRNITKDLTGCEGYSKERPPRANEVKCACCGEWVKEEETFQDINTHKHICFKCF